LGPQLVDELFQGELFNLGIPIWGRTILFGDPNLLNVEQAGLGRLSDKLFIQKEISHKHFVVLRGCVIVALQGCVIVVFQDCVIVVLQGCVIGVLQDCVIVALQGFVIVVLQGCVIVALQGCMIAQC
jgi:hypothetical protein